MGNQPFVLILNLYKSHIESVVKKEAEKLENKLIFVLACGTGCYQQFDRIIYSVIKEKLVTHQMVNEDSSDNSRWNKILSEMKKIWNEINEETILSVWEIPKENELLTDDEDDSETSDDEWNPNNETINEE